MGKALYRKYRSKSLSEIIGQEHITTTLDNALKSGKISHAYLFTGPKGVGKTSIARILAYEVNGLPYDEEATNLDIIEIDAASNRGVEDIRELRDKINISPSSSKYKVYIIDEVHMLTNVAFNALLKTLEEPPAHAIFILATTEAHKLPETIISRTQRFSFKPIDDKKAVEHLKTIAKKEDIKISDDALELIVEHGAGSFRDSIGLLEQTSSLKKDISADDVRNLLGIAPAKNIVELYNTVTAGSSGEVLTNIAKLTNQGFSAPNIAKQLAGYLREKLLNNEVTSSTAIKLLEELLRVPSTNDSLGLLEIILLGANLELNPAGLKQSLDVKDLSLEKPQGKDEKEPVPKKQNNNKSEPLISNLHPPTSSVPLDNFWPEILKTIKQRYNTLYGILRMAEANIEEDKLRLGFAFAFHQKRLTEAKNQQILADVIEQTLGRPLTIDCYITNKKPAAKTETPKAKPEIENISNIFGDVEVVD